jgi:hypothetical protein
MSDKLFSVPNADQQIMDTFYHRHGKCCAGCDWWRYHNSLSGECHRSAPVSGAERFAMLGMESCSMALTAGHVFTPRDHVCGDFKDDFDWLSMPPAYLRKIGFHASVIS